MNITISNGYVLFTHPADWATAPDWSRKWETGITAAVTGAEQRQGLRGLPRNALTYSISALSLEERALLDACLDAATESGLACCPYWGRASTLADAFNPEGDVATLTDTVWPWAIGDYAFLQSGSNGAAESYVTFDCLKVTGVAGAVITFQGNPVNAYLPGMLVWPVLFGKCSMDKENAMTSWHGDVKITVTELAAQHQADIGDAPAPPGPGIGSWKVGSTLVVS